MQPEVSPTGSAPRPFHVDIPQTTIDRILHRVRDTQWPDRLDATDWRYGANWDYMKALAQYWVERFDWRNAEANLNRYPQFLARVGDYDIHFYHVKGRGSAKPMPLILTHGWPGSVLEFIEAIGPLSDPASFGGSPDDAFDVVVPSLPGYGFSSKPKGKPIGPATTAALWNQLMTDVLGYNKYGAQGGDLANTIMTQLGRIHPGIPRRSTFQWCRPWGSTSASRIRTAAGRAGLAARRCRLPDDRDGLQLRATQQTSNRCPCLVG